MIMFNKLQNLMRIKIILKRIMLHKNLLIFLKTHQFLEKIVG